MVAVGSSGHRENTGRAGSTKCGASISLLLESWLRAPTPLLTAARCVAAELFPYQYSQQLIWDPAPCPAAARSVMPARSSGRASGPRKRQHEWRVPYRVASNVDYERTDQFVNATSSYQPNHRGDRPKLRSRRAGRMFIREWNSQDVFYCTMSWLHAKRHVDT